LNIMRQVFFLLLATSLGAFAQVKITTMSVMEAPTGATSIGSFINNKTPASITAFAAGAVFTSLDSGVTWTEAKIPGTKEAQGLHLANDTKGNLFYFYAVASEKGTEGLFSKSTDQGKKWSEPQVFGAAPGSASSFSLGSHPRKDILMVIWTQTGVDDEGKCATNIYMNETGSGGKKWSQPIRLNKVSGTCEDGGMLVSTSPAIARDGKAFVVWAGNEKILLDRSYDGGQMWINNDLPVADQKGGWRPEIPGSAQGGAALSIAIDNTDFRTIGTLYILYADQKLGLTDTDIWLVRTPNFGDNYTYPLRVNKDEPGAHQYSPKIAVDQASGFVYAVYFDRRANNGNLTDVYLAYSGDAGSSFVEKKINDAPISPDGKVPELLSVSAHKGTIHVMWTTNESGKTKVNSAILKQSAL
jgi:hypothetical protein